MRLKSTVIDNHDGTVSIKYVPTATGTYTTDINYGGVTIPSAHITQQVNSLHCLYTYRSIGLVLLCQ